MRLRGGLLAVWFALASAAGAEQVAVQTGEHDGFTRLVLDFAAPVGWTMTRTERGYRLLLDKPDLRFDLSKVFRPITQERLSSIWADPDSGALMIGVGCACHAFPFELRPDVLVIDLRDGPAPPGSSFELAEDGRAMPPVPARSALRPRQRPAKTPMATVTPAAREPGYDWLDRVIAEQAPAPRSAIDGDLLPDLSAMVQQSPAPDATRDADAGTRQTEAEVSVPGQALTPLASQEADGVAAASSSATDSLRAELLRQISNGAARGVVEMATGAAGPAGTPGRSGHAPLPQIRIGGAAGIDPAAGERPSHALTAEGIRCLPDKAVDVAAWGADTPVAETIATRTAALYAEFDAVDPEAAAAAVRYLLHLGFGAEARTLIETLPLEGPDVPLWSALAAVVDGGHPPEGPLSGMEVCDGQVALWGVLARPDLTAGNPVQSGAVLRTFSALPLHLRRHLGPMLADRFLARGDARTVRAIRDAILRPGGDPGPAVRLMEAELHAAEGRGADTSALIALQSAPGPTAAEATVAAIRAIVAGGGTVDMGMLTATEALMREYKGAAEEPGLRHALALAQATQGNFDAAFALLPAAEDHSADLWALLAERGGEVAVVTHGLRGDKGQVPSVPLAVRHGMARRLIDLGFPDGALDWLEAVPPPEGETRDRHLLLAAEADLRRRDARGAVARLAAIAGPEAALLRNEALMRLGTPQPLERVQADTLASEDQRLQAARLAENWEQLAREGPEIWRDAAALVAVTPANAETPPLARAEALLAESAKAREALLRLIAATPAPPEANAVAGGS